jgi:major membrane immunogen (membrane-anchored lipoprotein)
LSIDKNNRQRGNDEADAPLLVEGENSAEEVDVVIGAVKSNEADHKAADELKAALGVKSKELAAALIGF